LPFGSWPSPLGADQLVAGSLGLAFPVAVGGELFWQEARPAERGRVAVVAGRPIPDGAWRQRDVLPEGMSARTAVHEYGGRAWVPAGDGAVVTSALADQRLWWVSGGEARAMTPEPPLERSVRYGCPVVSPDGAWLVAVRERHLPTGVVNDLVSLPLAGGDGLQAEPSVLAQGHDFYSSPCFSPGGRELAFVCWDHPNMPWDGTALVVGGFGEGRLVGEARTMAGGAGGAVSVLQPRWSPGGRLAWLSDETGWWNLYLDGRPLAPVEAEFAGPAWALGESDYAFLPGGELMATWSSGGRAYLGRVAGGRAEAFELDDTSFCHLSAVGEGFTLGPGVLAVAGGPRSPRRLVHVGPGGRSTDIRWSSSRLLADEWISVGRHFSFATSHGASAHATFYPPVNPTVQGPAGEAPPVVLTSHGGPTGSSSGVLELRTQYWTTRGLAVLDVDYRGSTGYGRVYRQALEGGWGVLDVDDCDAARREAGRRGWVDAGLAVVRGSSAGGLTALALLARGGFLGGAVRYAVCDVATLSADSPKFESRYTGRLLPAASAPERSPVNFAPAVRCPVLMLQGLDDPVVPASQAVAMAEALRAAGGRAVLVLIEGEGHGFRQAWAMVRSQEAELAFFRRVLGVGEAAEGAVGSADLDEAEKLGTVRWAAPGAPSGYR
jgi:dipeptidyl aminopeptidase/acylaminoacyl peptidase